MPNFGVPVCRRPRCQRLIRDLGRDAPTPGSPNVTGVFLFTSPPMHYGGHDTARQKSRRTIRVRRRGGCAAEAGAAAGERHADRDGGRTAGHALSFARELVEQAEVVFDVVAFPPPTPLVRLRGGLGLATLTGAEVIAVQAAEQFVHSTGVRPSPDQVRRASDFSRA